MSHRARRTCVFVLVAAGALAAPPGARASDERTEETLVPGLRHIVLRRGSPSSTQRYRVLAGSYESQASADELWSRLERAGIVARPHYRGGSYLIAVDALPDLESAQDIKRRIESARVAEQDIVIQDYEQDVTHVDGPWEIHVLEADPEAIRIEVAHAYDAAIGVETMSTLVRRRGALAGINGGYYLEGGLLEGDALGALKIDGVVFSEPDRGRGAVGFYEENGRTRTRFNRLAFRGALVLDDGRRVSVDGIDRRCGEDEIVLYGPEFHRTTLTGSEGTQIVVDAGRVRSIAERHGSTRIPANGYVICLGRGREELPRWLDLGARVQVETALTPLLPGEIDGWDRTPFVLGGGPLLIRGGKRIEDYASEAISRVFFESRHPRTAVAARRDGTLLFVTVDGRQPERSVGMSLGELTDLLLELEAHAAVNLDGGGSTTMILDGRLANVPSDPLGERETATAVLLFARRGER